MFCKKVINLIQMSFSLILEKHVKIKWVGNLLPGLFLVLLYARLFAKNRKANYHGLQIYEY